MNNVIFPSVLKKNSRLAVWAPSSPAPFLFPKRFSRAVKALENEGFKVSIGNSCKKNLYYHKEFQKDFAQEFHEALINPDIDGILFATGGWTSIAVLQYIDWSVVKQYPKVIMGYSDATPFLLACYKKTGLVTYHGPMVVSEWGEHGGPWEYTLEHFKMVFSQKILNLSAPSTWTEEMLWWDRDDDRKRKVTNTGEWNYLKTGYAKGKIIGGNLTTLCLLLGTEYFPDLTDSIFFIEDQDCSPDKFLAQLYHLKLNGIFDKISGLIIGRIANKRKAASGFDDFYKIINNVLEGFNKPVLTDVDLGHTEPMLTIPIGAQAEINSETNSFIIYNGGIVFEHNNKS